MVYDASALLIGYEILAALSEAHFGQVYIICATVGGALGTGLVAWQEKKEKKKRALAKQKSVKVQEVKSGPVVPVVTETREVCA